MLDSHSPVTRRDFLRTNVIALAGAPLTAVARTDQDGSLDPRKAALGVARWLENCRIASGNTFVCPADPLNPKSVSTNLYSGVAGVALFWAEAYLATEENRFMNYAGECGKFLQAKLRDSTTPANCGLYTGLAGMAFALEKIGDVTGLKMFHLEALGSLKRIRGLAKPAGKGVEWSDVTDIIGGSAGIGLYLLDAFRAGAKSSEILQSERAVCVETAKAAGLRLLELGQPEAGGLKWRMSPKFPRLMPNFSHGAAGISYFLASLFQHTKEKQFLDGALSGAKYLQAVANMKDDTCQIFHNEPDGKDLYYLGWCHGPVGTARLFYRLHQITDDAAWMDLVHRCARSIMRSGIPERPTPGFWNNVSQCCGSAGVADFFLSLHRITKKPEYLAFCEKMTADLIRRATHDEKGYRWSQAEHRIKPDETVAQTGYMQGAAGIGMLLLRLDAHRRGREPLVTLPDSPF